MVVPPYCRDRLGRVYRILRSSQLIAPDRVRFSLRAQTIRLDAADPGIEVSRELEAGLLLDKAANRQVVPSPESVFEQLWHELHLDLNHRDG